MIDINTKFYSDLNKALESKDDDDKNHTTDEEIPQVEMTLKNMKTVK